MNIFRSSFYHSSVVSIQIEEQGEMREEKSVEQVKELVVLVPMMDVLMRHLYALSGDIANVLHTNLEILNVVLALIMVPWQWEQEQELKIKFVELAKELAVLDPMMGVLKRLQYVQSGDTANVLHTNLETLNVDLDLIPREELGLAEKEE